VRLPIIANALSIAFSSWRTLPGQGKAINRRIASWDTVGASPAGGSEDPPLRNF
jgi:hypothetical protein